MAHHSPSPLEPGISAELLERLDLVSRAFDRALVINTGSRLLADGLRKRGMSVDETDHGAAYAQSAQGLYCDEDRLPVAPGSYDLVAMPCGLDTVDDVPGAMIAARRALQPGGLFLGCLVAAPSLTTFRELAQKADAAQDRAIARFHPQIDVRAAGDLLARAGFALPVADCETLSLSYTSLAHLLRDLREAGLTNVLAERHAVTREWLEIVGRLFIGLADDKGRVNETVSLLFLTGWAPEQPPGK